MDMDSLLCLNRIIAQQTDVIVRSSFKFKIITLLLIIFYWHVWGSVNKETIEFPCQRKKETRYHSLWHKENSVEIPLTDPT